nr:Aldose-ketose isomerase YihS [Salmonella sp. NCTC 7297]
MKWFNTLSHNRWLEQETDRIFTFGKHAAVPTGFGWLGNKGQIKEEMGTHLWITARMLPRLFRGGVHGPTRRL